MLFIYFLTLFYLVSTAPSYDWTPLEEVMKQGIADRAFPGGVVAVGNTTHVIYSSAFGHFTYEREIYELKVAEDSKYDVASITKIMATTLAVMNLASSGALKVDDLVSKYIENYDTNKKGNTTIKNLLLHNAGLPFDYPGPLPETQQDVIDYIRFIKPVTPVGTKFSYSNLGFLLLGKIVEKVSKKNFNDYCMQNRIFASLKDTGFNPSSSDFYRIPPTEYDQGNPFLIV